MIKILLQQKYGDKVAINYIDVDDDPEVDKHPQILKIMDEKSAPLPIVTINEEPIFAGAVSYPHIVSELTKRGIKIEN